MPSQQLTCVVLAGGQGLRMQGKDKGLIKLGNLLLIEHIVEQIRPQCESILINANRHIDRYQRLGYPVICDRYSNYQGPLAGIHAALTHTQSQHLITLPCDTLTVPPNYIKRMWRYHKMADNKIVVAHDGERLQPVYALIPTEFEGSLQAYLQSGNRKIDHWYKQHNMLVADFSDVSEAFHNFNHPTDLKEFKIKKANNKYHT